MMKSTLVLLGLLWICPALAESEPLERLAASVRDLGLGEGAFVIGSHLSADQLELALAKNRRCHVFQFRHFIGLVIADNPFTPGDMLWLTANPDYCKRIAIVVEPTLPGPAGLE